MKLSDVDTIDFETFAIERRPHYPPKPVGVSLRLAGKRKSKYYAWGHPTKNNCTFREGREAVRKVYAKKGPMLFHHGKFDIDVAEEHLNLKMPSWDRIHDTMFLLFLSDPHARTFALKPSSERVLDLPPTEQDELKDWIIKNIFTSEKSGGGDVCILAPGCAKPRSYFKIPPTKTGAFIAYTPGDLAGRYAEGDTDRTLALFKVLYPEIKKRGMLEPYDRERRLMPILLQNERDGLRVRRRLLESDYEEYQDSFNRASSYLKRRLKSKTINLDSDEELADALDVGGFVSEWALTEENHQRSVSKENLTLDKFTDKKIGLALYYRSGLRTCMNTFMLPWLDMSKDTGRIYTNWNQVRQARGKGFAGAVTGRLSSNPNFMNIPTSFEDKGNGYQHPGFITKLKPLPLMRQYILPEIGHYFCHRDYSQQELRILAHYEDGALLFAYQQNPRMDVHIFVQDLIQKVCGLYFPRKPIKITNFGLIYGMGIYALSVQIGDTEDQARKLKTAHRKALPSVKELDDELKEIAHDGGFITTWGGRQYYCEEPKMIKGRLRDLAYKMINKLIQGSAADCTKEAIIRYDKARETGKFLVTVHDEIDTSFPKSSYRKEMQILNDCMGSIEFDAPMISDAKYGSNWGNLKPFREGV